MALDTRAKRASAIGVSFYPGFSVHPDEIKGQEWRQSVGYGYSGNLVDALADITLTVGPQESMASVGFIPGLSEQLGSRGFIQTGYQMEYRVFGSQLDRADESNRINLLTRSDQMKYLLTDYLIGAIDG